MNIGEYRRKAILLLLPDQKKSIIRLTIFTVFAGLLEIISISIFLPFLNFAGLKGQNEFFKLQEKHQILKHLSFEYFLIILGILCVVLIIFVNISRILVTLFTARIISKTEAHLSTLAIKSILEKPYQWFGNQDIKGLYKFPLSEASHLVSVCYYPFINFITSSIILLMLVCSALIVNAAIVLTVALLIGASLCIYYILTRKMIEKNAEDRGNANNSKYILATDIITSHQEIKLYKAEAYFIKQYFNLSNRLASSQAFIQVVGNLPRYIIEGTLIVVAIILMLISIRSGTQLQNYIPLMGFFAIFVIRALPHAQLIYNSVNQVEYAKPALLQFSNNVDITPNTTGEIFINEGYLTNRILFNNYEKVGNDRHRKIIKVDSVSIDVGEKIAIIGASGSGKSTLLSAICGFEAETDSLQYVSDDCRLLKNEQHNQNVAFVPQEILHTSTSIRNNLTFGDLSISDKKIIEALECVQLWQQIKSFPKNLDEKIYGQKVKLSGGQLQRLCIARALIKERNWLVLDEPFAALDPTLELMIINEVFKVYSGKSIILSTHRFENLDHFDRIIYMKDGAINLDGHHTQLLEYPEYKKYVLG